MIFPSRRHCVFLWVFLALTAAFLPAEAVPGADSPLLPVGAAKCDITPEYPIRLSGYGSRRNPNAGIAQRLHAKALALGDESTGGPCVLITVDNLGVPASMRAEVLRRLSRQTPLQDRNLAICSSHTHCAPVLSGVIPNIFGTDLPADHQKAIDRYTTELTEALEKVALSALANRRPSRLAWGIGSVNFASNRRSFPKRPVDHALPVLRVTDPAGTVTAVLTSYACHCTTLGFDAIHGDWAGCAQEALEREFPGAIALTAVGCGADQNPIPRRTLELAREYGSQLAAEAARLARSKLIPLSQTPQVSARSIQLPLGTPPTREMWQTLASSPTSSAAIAYQARRNLDRLQHGESLPNSLPYLIQTWSFGEDLAMVFLPGEVVVDYSLRFKTEFDHRRLWINAYSNDLTCYIPSKRVLDEGGYEGAGAMVYYDRPAPFAPDVESRIASAVRDVLPKTFQAKTPAFPSPYISGNPQLTLPRDIYAVAGTECSVAFANTLLAEDPTRFRFEVDCALGKAEPNRWVLNPTPIEVGTHQFTLRLLDEAGRAKASSKATLHVAASDSGAQRNQTSILIVGDSLTAAGIYPAELARLFSLPGNPALKMLGTRKGKPASQGSPEPRFEGYGGWSWNAFLTQYDAAEPDSGKVNKSPFVFPRADTGAVEADFQRFLSERAGGEAPDFITVLLGINDCFALKADNPTALDQGITQMLLNAEELIAQFRKAAPKATIGICLVPTPNDREDAFVANYKDKYPRWNWKQVQHRVVQRQLRHFFDREKENLHVIPTGLNLDSWNGYPDDNAVHPNEKGYRQIAASLYAWLKNKLADANTPTANP